MKIIFLKLEELSPIPNLMTLSRLVSVPTLFDTWKGVNWSKRGRYPLVKPCNCTSSLVELDGRERSVVEGRVAPLFVRLGEV